VKLKTTSGNIFYRNYEYQPITAVNEIRLIRPTSFLGAKDKAGGKSFYKAFKQRVKERLGTSSRHHAADNVKHFEIIHAILEKPAKHHAVSYTW
jgi:hypothetical protein